MRNLLPEQMRLQTQRKWLKKPMLQAIQEMVEFSSGQ
jgi:hypothetical protein